MSSSVQTAVFPTDAAADVLIDRARGEFLDNPGLRVTPSQAQRLFGMTPHETAVVLDHLLTVRFLRKTRDGLFGRA